MLKIIRADILDGQTLDIELNNGHLILFDTSQLPQKNHRFASLCKVEVLPRPSTDGSRIYWKDGTEITLTEILQWISKPLEENKQEE